MIRDIFFPGLAATGPVHDGVLAVRDGFVNFYIVQAPAGLICIDAGWSSAGVERGFRTLGLQREDVAALFLTHAHWDHCRCVDLYPNAEIFVGEQEYSTIVAKRKTAQSPVKVRDGEVPKVAGLTVRVIATPGHTAGSTCYLVGAGLLFTGDILRLRRGTALPFYAIFNGDGEALARSIAKLASLPGIECLLTAHTGITTDPAYALRQWRGPYQEENGP